jgi:hypothetical protein
MRYRSIYAPAKGAAAKRRKTATALQRVEQIGSSARRSGPGVD